MKKICANNECKVRHSCKNGILPEGVNPKQKYIWCKGGRNCAKFVIKEHLKENDTHLSVCEIMRKAERLQNDANFALIFEIWYKAYETTGNKPPKSFFIFKNGNGIASLPPVYVDEKTKELKLYD